MVIIEYKKESIPIYEKWASWIDTELYYFLSSRMLLYPNGSDKIDKRKFIPYIVPKLFMVGWRVSIFIASISIIVHNLIQE